MPVSRSEALQWPGAEAEAETDITQTQTQVQRYPGASGRAIEAFRWPGLSGGGGGVAPWHKSRSRVRPRPRPTKTRPSHGVSRNRSQISLLAPVHLSITYSGNESRASTA